MWNKEGACRKAATGISRDVSELRKDCGVSQSKETVCAEEILLVRNQPWSQWIISASYDLTNGWKTACKKGCNTILAKLDITDAGRDLRWKANARGKVKSWSTKPE
jgi:hypothetical protein